MAITYNLIPNTIKTLDVDGLIFPFNKGQIIPGGVSDYTQESFDETSNLNYALAMDMNDIIYNYLGDINSQIEDKIRSVEPRHTDDGDRIGDIYTVSWSIPAKTVEYTAYNGLSIKLSNNQYNITTIVKYSKYYDLEGTYYYLETDFSLTINKQPVKQGFDYWLVDVSSKKYYSAATTFYGKRYNIYKQNPILFIGGFYSDNMYAVGTILSYEAYYKKEMFLKILDVSDYNNSLLTYNTLISNTKLNGNPVSVKPTETSFYIGFIFRNSSNVSTWNNTTIIARVGLGRFPGEIGGNTQTEYTQDSCFGSYDETKLQNFFNTKNLPSEEMSPFEPSGGGGDPYDKDPDSQGNNDPGGHKGGNGKYQDTDEDVPIPGLPQISAVDTGLCTLLNPTKQQLEKLSEFLWSDAFSVDSFKKIFADPMDVILGLSIVPLKVASDNIMRRIKISGIDTGVEMYKCASQYIEVDCGSIDITNYWDNFMDYEPYTQYTIYLPYVGYKVLHADELVDKTITVKYHCDILSGACMAYVQCGKKVLYCFEGNISIQIPVTSASYDNMIHGILQMASGVGQIIAGGASMAAGGAGAGLMVSGAVGTATGATSAIKPTIGRSGNAESSTGLMGIQKPYLIISRPRAVVPSGLNKYSGYPAYKGGKLGDFNNFTVVQDIRIKNLNGATMEEMNEAERLCKEGVIV